MNSHLHLQPGTLIQHMKHSKRLFVVLGYRMCSGIVDDNDFEQIKILDSNGEIFYCSAIYKNHTPGFRHWIIV